MCSHEDFIPTFAAAAGESQIVQKLRKGHEIGHRTYKVHLDGQNLLPFFKGGTKESPRKGFMYWSDDGFSKNRRAKASRCGNAISPICVFPIYITFEQIPSNAATKASSTKSGWQTVFRSSSGAGNRSRVAGKLQGISSTPETGKLQPRPRDGTDDRAQSRIKDVHDRLPKQSLNTLSLRGSVRRAAKTTLRNHGGTSVNSSSCSLVRRRALSRFRLWLPAWANRVAS